MNYVVYRLKPNTNRRRRRDSTVEWRRVGDVYMNSQLTSPRRLPTDSVDNLETEHSGFTTRILNDIDYFFNNDIIMSPLVSNLNSLTVIGSAAQEIVNWVTTADGCVHTADATQLDV